MGLIDLASLLQWPAIVGGGLLLVWLIYRWIKGSGRKEGRQEVIVESQEAGLDAVQQAKRVEEAARAGTDPEWQQRVHDRFRRPPGT